MNTIFSMLLLLAVITMCLTGLYHANFDDNLGQCAGMAVVTVWAVAALVRAASYRYVGPDDAFVCIGMLAYGAGSGVRTWLYTRKKR